MVLANSPRQSNKLKLDKKWRPKEANRNARKEALNKKIGTKLRR